MISHYLSSTLKFISMTLLLSFSIACTTTENKTSCIENRAAFDFGSGSTKALAAKVNLCEKKILKIYFNGWESLKFKESLSASKGLIPDPLIATAITKVNEWKNQFKDFKILTYKAVATEVFRQAQNGESTLAEISKKTGLQVALIDQTQESILGFWSAIGTLGVDPQTVIVWDIGGGSMQISYLNSKNEIQTYMGKLASVSFKDEIVKLKKSKSLSPNPLGSKLAEQAIDLAYRYARQNLSQELLTEVKTRKVIGIGGVHAKSILNQTKTNAAYTIADLKKILKERLAWNDKKIGGQYPETEVTNLALVIGFMKAMDIPEVNVADVNLSHGLILQK